MKKSQIIRAWRDEEYYQSLSAEERAALPEHPAAFIDLDEATLNNIAAARVPGIIIADDPSYTHPTGAGCTICCA